MRRGPGLLGAGWAVIATGVAAWRLHAQGLLREPFLPYADQTFQAVLVQRAADPTRYRNDAMVEALDAFWPDGWFRLLSWWTGWFPSLEAAWSVATLAVALVFLGGLVRLGWRLSGSVTVGGIVALATAAIDRDSFIGEWSVVPVMPRVVVLSCAPWLLAALAPGGSLRGRHLAFFGVGLLAWVHSLSAFQLAWCMAGVLCLTQGSGQRARALLVAGALALLGALPAVADLPQVRGSADLEALRHTSFAYYLHLPLYKALRILLQFLVLAAVALFGLQRGGLDARSRRFLAALGGTALVLAMLHPICTLHPRALALAPLRWLVYLFPVLLILGAAGIARGLASKTLHLRLMALAALALLVLPIPDRTYELAWDRLPWLERSLDASLAARPELFQATLGLGGQEEAVRALGAEIQRLVGRDEVILAPPRGASTLRLFGQRALYVTAEDSVLALYDETGFREFQRRYDRARRAYGDPSGAELRLLAAEEDLRWMLVSEDGPRPGPVRAQGAGLVLVGPLGGT